MIKVCLKCKTENDQGGNYCQFCGNKMIRTEPEKQKKVSIYLRNGKSFQELFEEYEDDNLTIEQIKNLYQAVYEIELLATFEENTLIKLEIV